MNFNFVANPVIILVIMIISNGIILPKNKFFDILIIEK